VAFNNVRVKVRRMIALNNGPFASLLTFVYIFVDYPLLDSVFRSPPRGWSRSQLDWITFTSLSTCRKTASYLLSQEKKLLAAGRRENWRESKGSGEPLVSVIIPTYKRANILANRTVPSVLNQTHKNLELIIVGDHCTDGTEELLKKIEDPRLRFINLPERGCYPKEALLRWYVAGVTPVNVGLMASRGEWIAHLDDDDEFCADHIETLLRFALKNDYEMVYGVVNNENSDGSWSTLGRSSIELGNICRSAAMYRGYLRVFLYDIKSWQKGEPADFNLWRRMKKAGVRIGFLNRFVGIHHKEQSALNVKLE
jgi:hypothetical protein